MRLLASALVLGLPLAVLGQEANPVQNMPQQASQPSGGTPIFRVQVVSRSIAAVSYRDRSGWTKIDFQGTSLAPQAKGTAQVQEENGHTTIKVDLKDLPSARTFGDLYLTYVLWAITPDGHPSNIGEIVVGSHGNYQNTFTTGLQAFGLIVTAEPYFDVHEPSDAVVMENIVRNTTEGKWETVNAKYELLPRGNYTYQVPSSQRKPVDLNSNKKSPLEVYEAQNAVQIARYAKADQYASDVYQDAQKLWQQAEDYEARKEWKSAIMTAREAVEKAEDARVVSLRKQQQEAQEKEREEAAARQAAAQRQAEEEAARAQQAAQQAQQAEQQAQLQAQQREAAEKAKEEADAARAQAAAEADKARVAAAEADRLRQQAEQQREQLREQLLQQFNAVLPTRETTRGLVVNMQDVLFATGKYQLSQSAQLALARISGIIVSHPGLNIHVEGYTDSTGTVNFNQKLSDERAETVKNFLVSQGVDPQTVTSQGYGESYPVAPNETAAGRQLNRRVELVISGEVIGVKIGVPPSQAQGQNNTPGQPAPPESKPIPPQSGGTQAAPPAGTPPQR